ncbi:MAG: DUF2240 family protein [Archaeoglobaceae archaeon]|nr:DUF2240 family protein [Archaeoglobaceae archaeon]
MGFNLEDVIEISKKSLAEEIVEEIVKRTGKSYQEIFSMISERQEKMNNVLSFEVVALIVAKEFGVEISRFLSLVEERIIHATTH